MNVINAVYDALLADDVIREETSFRNEWGDMDHRIKFYEYPESGNVDGPFIIIDPLGPPLDSDYGDDEPIAEEYLYQIDVWTKKRTLTKDLAKRAKKALRKAGFYYYSGGLDEYDPDSKVFRDARRFRGKVYTEEFEMLD